MKSSYNNNDINYGDIIKTILFNRNPQKIVEFGILDGFSLKIFADAKVYAGLFNGTQSAQLRLDPKRKAYVHLITGSLTVNGHKLTAGDALLIAEESSLSIDGGVNAEVLFFDLSH